MGFESRGSRLARKYREENLALASKNAEVETRLTSVNTEREKLEVKVAMLEKERSASGARSGSVPGDRMAKLSSLLGGLGRPIVSVRGNQGIRLTSDLLFEPGKVEVKSSAIPLLTKVANVIKKLDSDVTVFIDGHTDSDPLNLTKKLYHNNYGLGAARANAVAKKLVAMGAPRERISTRSFGPDNPIASNSTPAGKRQNRRVEITFAVSDASTRVAKASGF